MLMKNLFLEICENIYYWCINEFKIYNTPYIIIILFV